MTGSPAPDPREPPREPFVIRQQDVVNAVSEVGHGKKWDELPPWFQENVVATAMDAARRAFQARADLSPDGAVPDSFCRDGHPVLWFRSADWPGFEKYEGVEQYCPICRARYEAQP